MDIVVIFHYFFGLETAADTMSSLISSGIIQIYYKLHLMSFAYSCFISDMFTLDLSLSLSLLFPSNPFDINI